MAKARTTFLCDDCGADSPKWAGQCPACGAWNTLVEVPFAVAAPVPVGARSGAAAQPSLPFAPAVSIAEVDRAHDLQWPTGLAEVDRVLGGGLVPGSVTLIGGEPGIGKSTLLTQLAASMAAQGQTVLYVSAEESTAQVHRRAHRLGALTPRLFLTAAANLDHVVAHLDQLSPAVVVVDSIQTVHDPSLAAGPGSVTQVRACAQRLVHEAKLRCVAVVLVGHVTKEGDLAGPRVLEHMVDSVLSFDGERHHALRLLRVVKHRFGATADLGVFEMGETGLAAVPDASALFLADRCEGVSGSMVAPTMDGRRPILVEVQALVTESALSVPRRSAQGLDAGRLAFLLAVLMKRVGLPIGKHDVFALAVGGAQAAEPGTDLAIALAVASSAAGVPLPADVVACAEVGLGGELRQVGQMPRRLAEAARVGFTRALVPLSAPDPPPGIELVRAATITDALLLITPTK